MLISSISGQAREPSGAAEQFEVVVRLVIRRLAFCRNRNRSRQKPASPIARVADALGYAGPPGDPRSVEGVLEKQRRIEFLAAKLGGQPLSSPEAFVLASVFVHEDAIGITLPAI